MIITFSGIDGSGKTTYAESAVAYLQGKGSSAKYRHSARDSFYHIILHNVIGKISASSKASIEAALRSKEKRGRFFVMKWIKKILLLMNLVFFNVCHRRYKGSRKKTLVCDRYFYDEIVQMEYLELAGNAFIDFYKSFIIKPDTAFFVTSDPVAAYERKKEFNKEYFIKKSDIYSKVCGQMPCIKVPDMGLEANKRYINTEIEKMMSVA